MPKKSLSLNFAPIQLTGGKQIKVGHQPYDENLLKTLRADFGTTHIFKRERDHDSITDIPVVSGALPLGSEVSEIDLCHTKWHWPSLLIASLLRIFNSRREIINDYPVEILGHSRNNYIEHEDLPSWIKILPVLQFTPRTIYDEAGKPTFGMLCDVRTRSQLLANGEELAAHGISLLGRYVKIALPLRDPRVSSRSLTVGKVKSIDGETLILEDHREGYETVQMADAQLTANRVDFDWCISVLLGKTSDQVLADARGKINALKSGPTRLSVINKTLAFLQTKTMEAAPGVTFEIDNWLSSDKTEFPKKEILNKPILVFDPAGTHTNTWNENGIKANGPYDQRTFSPKRLNIAIICQAQLEGQVDTFIAKFLDGMPNVLTGSRGREQARYADGFLRRFKLEKPNVQTFITTESTLEGYQSACRAALQNAVDTGTSWDLAIVQIEEKFKTYPGADNPYFGSKAILLRNNVAVQSIRIETMRDPDKSLVFSMNQISLACYAKLGGRPWLLSAQQTVAHELVIGLGSHTEFKGRFNASTRHVGITTIFSSDGGYHLCERTGVVQFEEYAAALTNTLKRTILNIREEDNWKSTDKIRLIFHMFKPPKDIEADAIKSAVEGLKLENVTFAFLHIAPTHPFLVFDHNQAGLPPWEKNPSKKKGVLGPSRGLHLKLGDYESLMVFAGASELKRASDGMPRACLLKLHRKSTFKDMTYLARQTFDFTAHSWRVMTPERFPITIKYSDQIAQRLSGLKQIADWDDDAVRFRSIGRTPWFL